jgi:hypothetical protein
VIAPPDRRANRPQREFLEWHRDTVLKNPHELSAVMAAGRSPR